MKHSSLLVSNTTRGLCRVEQNGSWAQKFYTWTVHADTENLNHFRCWVQQSWTQIKKLCGAHTLQVPPANNPSNETNARVFKTNQTWTHMMFPKHLSDTSHFCLCFTLCIGGQSCHVIDHHPTPNATNPNPETTNDCPWSPSVIHIVFPEPFSQTWEMLFPSTQTKHFHDKPCGPSSC